MHIIELNKKIDQFKYEFHSRRNYKPLNLADAIELAKESLKVLGDNYSCIYERMWEGGGKVYVMTEEPSWDGECDYRVDGDGGNWTPIIGRAIIRPTDYPQSMVEQLLRKENDVQFKLIRYGQNIEGHHRTYRLRNFGSPALKLDMNRMWSPF